MEKKSYNYKKFKDKKLQEMVEEEIYKSMEDSENSVARIVAFIAHNFTPTNHLIESIKKYKGDKR